MSPSASLLEDITLGLITVIDLHITILVTTLIGITTQDTITRVDTTITLGALTLDATITKSVTTKRGVPIDEPGIDVPGEDRYTGLRIPSSIYLSSTSTFFFQQD